MSSEEFQALNDDELDQVVGGKKKHGKKRNGVPHLDESSCFDCGVCADVCGQGAITESGGCYHINASLCNGCGNCVNNCAFGAIWW